MNAKKDWHQKDNGMIWKDKMQKLTTRILFWCDHKIS